MTADTDDKPKTDAQRREPRRVLVIYHHFAHYRGPILRELIRSDQFEFHFAGDRSDPLDGTVKTYTDIPEDRFIYTPWLKIKGWMVWQKNLLRHVISRRFPQIILLGNVHFPSNWFMAIAARLARKRMLIWSHGWREMPTGLKRHIYKLFFSMGHGLLLYEHYAKNIAIAQGFKPEDIYVVYNSLDYDKQVAIRASLTPEQIQAERERLFPGSDRPIVMLSSRMIRRRRYHLAVEAAGKLKRQGHEVNLLFVGDGPAREELEAQCKQEGVSAHFVGACYDEETLALLFSASACTLSPGPIGLAVTHSHVYGRPVLVSNNRSEQGPEWGTIIPGRNGDHFVNDNTDSMAEVIRRWTPTAVVNEQVEAVCRRSVERSYNPRAQRRVFELAMNGEPANDLLLSSPPTEADGRSE